MITTVKVTEYYFLQRNKPRKTKEKTPHLLHFRNCDWTQKEKAKIRENASVLP
jgi:hypothetical protein